MYIAQNLFLYENEILLMVLKAFQDVVCEVYKTNT